MGRFARYPRWQMKKQNHRFRSGSRSDSLAAMKRLPLALLSPLLFATSPAMAQENEEAMLDPEQVLAEAPADHWLQIPVSDLMVMTLPPAEDGTARQLIIQLFPAPLSGGHVRNVRKLAQSGWWDGTKIYRVSPNFVTQFGGNPVGKAPPKSLETVPESEFFNESIGEEWSKDEALLTERLTYANEQEKAGIPPLSEMIWEQEADKVGFAAGWPVGMKDGEYYPITCRGSLSPAHYDPPDTGSGTEISIVTGQAARNLDTTFGFVGRVIDGLEHAINLPKGDDGWGFYTDKAKLIPILSITPASALPVAEQPRYEYLASWSPHLLRLLQAHGGYGNICSVDYPVRAQPKN